MERAVLRVFSLLVPAVLCLCVPRVRAQKVPQPGSVKGRPKGVSLPPGLVLPKKGQKPAGRPGTNRPAAQFPLDLDRVSLYLSTLARLPGDSPRAQRILDLFAGQDPRVLQSLFANLFRRGPRGSSLAPLRGALRVIGELRFLPGLEVLKSALLARDLKILARPALETILKLDPAGGKRFLLSCLAAGASSLRRAAEELLRSRLGPGDAPLLAPFLKASRVDTRLRALRLLAGRLPLEGKSLLLEGLRDPALPCAREAARGLAQIDPFPEELKKILAGGPAGEPRLFGFALYAALLSCEKGRRDCLSPDWAPGLLKGLSGGNPFVSSLCAAALARLSYASGDLTGRTFRDREVMDRLVSVLSGKVFFPEFGTVIGPVERAARLLSGRKGIIPGKEWARWWSLVREGFLARRARLPLKDEKNRARTVVVMKDPVETVAFIPLGSGEKPGPGEKAIYLPPREQAALVARLLSLGLEEGALARGGPDLTSAGGDRTITFVLRLEGREMSLSGRAGVPWTERIADELRNTIEKNLWQLYAPPGEGPRGNWLAEQRRFFARASGPERARRLKALVLAALPRLQGAERVRALGHLLSIPGLEGLLRDEDVDLLFSLVAKAPSVDPRTRALLEVMALKKGEKTWNRILSFLASRWDRGGRDCFLGLLNQSGPARIQAALSRPEAEVRAAAALFVGKSGNAVWRDRLRELLKDRDPSVRSAAVDALALLRDWASLGDVLRLARKDPSIQVRRSTLFFAGRSGDPRVLPVLLKALDSPLGSLRIAAIQGLGFSRVPKAADVLAGLVASDPEGAAGRLAARELSRWGGSHVRAAVRPLLRSPSAAVREAALWILADALDGSTVPALLRLLREPAKFRRARRALVLLTCRDFPRDPAAAYVKWYELHGAEPETAWFVEALRDAGYEPGFGPTDLLPGAPLDAVPRLVAIMKNAREWYFRVQAARRLQEITGKNFGIVTARTTAAERAAIAQAWLGWLEARKEKTAR